MYKHNWTKAFILTGLLALSATTSMAGTLEMLVIPCTPQLRPDECGVRISSTDVTATFTTNNNEVVNISAGMTVSVSGTGIVSQSSRTGTIVNFASAETGLTTGSIGGGGTGAGGGQTGSLPTGGSNSGGPTVGSTPVTTVGNLTTGGATGLSGPSTPGSP